MMDSCSEPAATNNTVVVMNRINNNNNTSETDTESGPVQHSQLGVFARRLSYAVLNNRFGSRRSLSTLRTHNNNNSLIDHHIGRQQPQQQQQQQRDYRSSHFNRARARTLRMTVIIVLAFILCWTPNVVMSVWFLADPSGAQKVMTATFHSQLQYVDQHNLTKATSERLPQREGSSSCLPLVYSKL